MALVNITDRQGRHVCSTDNAEGWFGTMIYGPAGADGRCEIFRSNKSESAPVSTRLFIAEGDKP